VASTLLGPLAASWPIAVHAGAQVEEPLADSVRSVLSAAIANRAPPKPIFKTIEERLAHLRWLGAMSERLKKRTAEHVTRVEISGDALVRRARGPGLDPR
jgi:hypothetical protein